MPSCGSQADYITTAEIQAARQRLSAFVLDQEQHTRQRLGFAWHPTPNAPATYPDLKCAFAHSQDTGESLPVSSEHTAAVIFVSPEVNLAFRYLHDSAHVLLGLDFTLPDEYELALWHLHQLEAVGYRRGDVEWEFLRADTLGQVLINAIGHRFPTDQQRFDLDCALKGFDHGVLAELRRTP